MNDFILVKTQKQFSSIKVFFKLKKGKIIQRSIKNLLTFYYDVKKRDLSRTTKN